VVDEEPPAKLNEVTDDVVGAAVEVHDRLRPGLLERAYEEALSAELDRRGIGCRSQVHQPLRYRGEQLSASYRLDLLVEGRVVVEIKAVSEVQPVHRAQLLT